MKKIEIAAVLSFVSLLSVAALADENGPLALLVPNFENGKPTGFKTFQIVPKSSYEQLGLKNGDVILEVDGKELTDAKTAADASKEIEHKSCSKIKILRNQKAKTLNCHHAT